MADIARGLHCRPSTPPSRTVRERAKHAALGMGSSTGDRADTPSYPEGEIFDQAIVQDRVPTD